MDGLSRLHVTEDEGLGTVEGGEVGLVAAEPLDAHYHCC